MRKEVHLYLAEIGKRGGSRSRRTLDPETAREMVRIREARRAYGRFHARCFWSCDPSYRIGAADIPWVVDGLRRHGDRGAWEVASRLCP